MEDVTLTPVNDGDTPETSVRIATDTGAPRPTRFNWQVHEAVQRCLNKGVWCYLGPMYGNMLVRIRAFHVPAVVTAQEVEERNVRRTRGVKDGEPTPGDMMIDVNRVAVAMAITGVKGEIDMGAPEIESSDPEILAGMEFTAAALNEARKVGIRVHDEDGRPVLRFDGSEDNEALRKVFLKLMKGSISLFTAIIGASKGLQNEKDEKIYKLGEAFVYGLPEASSLAG